nr:MAG TPA: hypothetical protein [Caudoviricetes sp.]
MRPHRVKGVRLSLGCTQNKRNGWRIRIPGGPNAEQKYHLYFFIKVFLIKRK